MKNIINFILFTTLVSCGSSQTSTQDKTIISESTKTPIATEDKTVEVTIKEEVKESSEELNNENYLIALTDATDIQKGKELYI
jgi:hypothetical protein